MTERLQVYKCEICGNIVEVLHPGEGTLVCCGQPMKLLEPGVTDGAVEKHVPVVEEVKEGYHVKVGSAPHPMQDKHYIEWIEVIDKNGDVTRHFLKPNENPEAFFDNIKKEDGVIVREYCNLHGLWQTTVGNKK